MEEDLKELLHHGREKFLAKDYAAAEPLLDRVIAMNPAFADVHNMLGVIHHDQGKFAKALESFQEALKINPNYTEAGLNLAVTYNDLGMYHEARAVFARARADNQPAKGDIDPFVKGKLANMHADLGEVYAAITQYDPAIAEYRKALALRPDFADIRVELGKSLRESGRLDESLEELKRAAGDRPRYAPGGVQLGLTYFALTRFAEAKTAWTAVLGYDAENARAKMFLRMVEDKAS